ncbi:Ferredoxin subunit of nitrite reductase or a ring-hydroxylating dioxygenase [Pricia antarctica]|uniref:Ferredoxin subunit of nitrite reductase or a ring-hydroxylating dioxygenase n=1 Tax=Pricia antarctica TaxID=641691 RepID=A0A1G7C7L4_9FLAO|nr:Rieske 2Fe-2S domain-containing protein [Pricia antarctica]SDE35321.1 Ferredoxin subunit of nitrite reductase or a ring-hydroxylating dioxygenase [Pricia antarctica]
MERKEFLKSIGSGAALAITFTCLGGCTKSNLTTDSPVVADPQTGEIFTIDLTASSYSELANNGGYILKSNVVVAKDLNGDYVAATVVCSHEFRPDVIYRNDEFYCRAHGARFSLTGKGLNSYGSRGLKVYKTSLDGNMLTISV